ncbi:synapse-associated protein 1 [Nephila pilipes]|uniref:Synapse-associated protein 1 n=1 Tax=Nephila pilipes TaxID=299642 RepID=A0A8X6JHZ6_NEPPI|nr:synapse-associated protein 1 [Nephila pilipes]
MSVNKNLCCSEKEIVDKINQPEAHESTCIESLENLTLENSSYNYCIPKEFSYLSRGKEPKFKIVNDISFRNMRDFSMQAIDSAKTFGNFITNFAQKTTDSISNTAQNLKSTLAKSNFLDNIINKERIVNFWKEMEQPEDIVAPWIGSVDEEYTKELILSLSEDKKIFLRNPPEGVFEFNLDNFLPVAELLLREDPRLQKMRFKLVPKRVKEEIFWRNYFYRIKLIQQSSKFQPSKHKSGLAETKDNELSLEQRRINDESLEENVNLDDDGIDIENKPSAQHEDSNTLIAPQKEDSFEHISQEEIQELNLSFYLNDENEKIEDKDLEKELEQMLEESEEHD